MVDVLKDTLKIIETAKQRIALFHYTTEQGLYGILESRTLWATHFNFLNDSSEFRYYFKALKEQAGYQAFYKRMSGKNLFAPNKLDEEKPANNINAQEEIEAYEIVFEQLLRKRPLFITSFCALDEGQIHFKKVQKKYDDGDLAMWRSYSVDGGYAIEFEKDKIDILLEEENEKFDYWIRPSKVEDVKYEPDKSVIKKICDQLESQKEDGKAVADMLLNCCVHKDDAFEAENEWRIFCFVNLKEEPNGSGKIFKKVRFRANDNAPYICLNESKNEQAKPGLLPIKRIIVGPHIDQKNRVIKLEIWLKTNGFENLIEVKPSSIPFLGMKK